MLLFIDIETIHSTSMTEEQARSLVKVPANYKKPESIDAYIDAHWEETRDRTALDPHAGSILCVGLATEEGEPEVFLVEDRREGDMLRQLGRRILELQREHHTDATMLGEEYTCPSCGEQTSQWTEETDQDLDPGASMFWHEADPVY